MKNHFIKSLMGLALIATLFSGCDLFSSAGDITFDADLPLDFVVNEQAINASSVSYSKTQNLDASSNADVAKYKDKIKEVKLNKITYVISDYTAPQPVTFTNGSIKTTVELASATAVNLQSSVQTELTNVNKAGFDEFAKKIKDNQNADVTLAGTFSSTPVAFKIRAYFNVTITANAAN
jgi:hypothetical protein